MLYFVDFALCPGGSLLGTGLLTVRPLSAHTASHLARIALGAIIGGNVASVVGIGTVAVQRGVSRAIASEGQRTAVEGQVPVGVDAVTGRGYGKCAAIDDDKTVGVGGEGILGPSAEAAKAGAVRPAGGVEAVIAETMSKIPSSMVMDRPSIPS